jgi:cysteine desulfurase/selenocysteine lyase
MSSNASAPYAASGSNSMLAFDVARVREDFPILRQEVYGKPLVYLDNAASAQKPRQVIGAMSHALETCYANVHRGAHYMSQHATDAYEQARAKVQAFLGAERPEEIIFTHGATEAINLVATSYGQGFLKQGDEVVLSVLEHHANIVPWQLLRERTGIEIKVAPIDDDGNFLFDEFEKLLTPRTKMVAITHISNALGTITPIAAIIEAAHAAGAKVLVDGCQAAPHQHLDVRALDADFYVFAPHKIYGPTGIGVLYGKADLLNAMPPYQGGGEMIRKVTFEETTFQDIPHRFEAGTPPIVEAIGLGAAVDYLSAIGQTAVEAHEAGLLAYASERLADIPGLTIIGRAREKASIVSFVMEGAHPHDIGTVIDRAGVAVRAGHHCAQPLMERFGLSATARASFGLYNTREEVDALADALAKVREIFA